jgi:type IV pilus assembly protein PilY1
MMRTRVYRAQRTTGRVMALLTLAACGLSLSTMQSVVGAITVSDKPVWTTGISLDDIRRAGEAEDPSTSGGTTLVEAGYLPGRAQGVLRKRYLQLDGQATTAWDAGDILTGTSGRAGYPASSARNIFTSRANVDRGLATIAFDWKALSSAQQDMLNRASPTATPDGKGERRLAYLRGERSGEGQDGPFRQRSGLLGDIVHANLLHVGVPSLPAPGLASARFTEFRERHASRPSMIYAAANDGMLHGFRADDGSEAFAFVPDALLGKLSRLTAPDYQAQAFFDGGLAASEAIVAGQWRTLLAGSLGGGAQSVIALDVTDPLHFQDGPGVLFEFTDAHDPDMGNLAGAPVFAVFNVSGKSSGPPVYRHFIVVASGLNNAVEDGFGRFNTDKAGALFLLSVDKPAASPWRLGTNYYKFRIPSQDTALPNGLSTPAIAIGADGAARHAYAGDSQGNLWKFDFTGALPWSDASSATPFFVARDAQGVRQAISTAPRIAHASDGYLILFGTGESPAADDQSADSASASSASSAASHTLYALHDPLVPGYAIASRQELARRVLAEGVSGSMTVSGATHKLGVMGAEKKGWFIDLQNGAALHEQAAIPPRLVDGKAVFSTKVTSSESKTPSGTRVYVLDPLTGMAVDNAGMGSAGRMLPDAIPSGVIVSTGKPKAGTPDPIGRRKTEKELRILPTGTTERIVEGGDATASARPFRITAREWAGRLAWREIPNLQELINDTAKP